ncbi:MAG: hypothetical protein AAF348_18460 [Bacteroidota bacterium]
MKNVRTVFVFTFLLAITYTSTLSAQFGNRFGRQQRSAIPQAQQAPEKPDPLTAEEIVEQRMPSITEELGLNPFEEAVVKTTLVKSVRQRIELQILNLEPQKMREELEKIGKNQNEELKNGLPEDKYNAYLELQENRFKTSKKKKKKKKKSKD